MTNFSKPKKKRECACNDIHTQSNLVCMGTDRFRVMHSINVPSAWPSKILLCIYYHFDIHKNIADRQNGRTSIPRENKKIKSA